MNVFDAVIIAIALVGLVTGFNAGLLRSLATIMAYIAAAPLAVALTPVVAAAAGGRLPADIARYLTPVLFILVGLGLGAMMRSAVGAIAGDHPSVLDRGLGAMLGAIRIGLVAVLVVVAFDRIIPHDREPAWLSTSRLRTYLSQAGAQGLRVLPADALAGIDKLKRERGI